jgi:hypothetical protein
VEAKDRNRTKEREKYTMTDKQKERAVSKDVLEWLASLHLSPT